MVNVHFIVGGPRQDLFLVDLSNIYSLHMMQDATNIFTITIHFP